MCRCRLCRFQEHRRPPQTRVWRQWCKPVSRLHIDGVLCRVRMSRLRVERRREWTITVLVTSLEAHRYHMIWLPTDRRGTWQTKNVVRVRMPAISKRRRIRRMFRSVAAGVWRDLSCRTPQTCQVRRVVLNDQHRLPRKCRSWPSAEPSPWNAISDRQIAKGCSLESKRRVGATGPETDVRSSRWWCSS